MRSVVGTLVLPIPLLPPPSGGWVPRTPHDGTTADAVHAIIFFRSGRWQKLCKTKSITERSCFYATNVPSSARWGWETMARERGSRFLFRRVVVVPRAGEGRSDVAVVQPRR
jgi:hypothetical protein